MSISNLGFETVVRPAFDFLQSEFGFACRRSSATAVLYVSPDAEVEVTFDIRSYEIDVEVKQREAGRSFPLHRVIQLVSVTEAERWRTVQASSPARVRKFVPQLADLLRKYGRSALVGDPKTFAKLAELEEYEAMRTTRDLQIRQARKLAEIEWKAKNYRKLVSILAPIQEELTASELAKFIYAKKKLES
jgi:hypothetical protein